MFKNPKNCVHNNQQFNSYDSLQIKIKEYNSFYYDSICRPIA